MSIDADSARTVVDGWDLTLVRTPLLGPEDHISTTVIRHVPVLNAEDTLVISEKVAVMTTGRTLPKDDYRPGWLAKSLARKVRPRPGSRGVSVPEKMEYVIRALGPARVLAACAASAATRPLGIKGVFYRVAGPLARDLDGGRPPFEHLLFPPLTDDEAQDLCEDLADTFGCAVVVADINDYGGSIRGRSQQAPQDEVLMRLLRDNPMGQRDQYTPLVVLTPPGAVSRRSARW